MKKIILSLLFVLITTSAFAKWHILGGGTKWYFTKDYRQLHKFTDINNKTIVRLVKNMDTNRYHIEVNASLSDYNIAYSVEEYLKEIREGKLNNNFSTSVYLSSPGGYVSSGIELGRVLRKYGASARVIMDQKCSSACAIAFIGGKFRSIDENGKVGIHTPYIVGKYGTSKCTTKYSELGIKLIEYINEMLSEYDAKAFIEQTFSNCSDKLIYEKNNSYLETK